MKIICLAACLAAYSSAFASFEVLMQIDRDSGENPAVRRFDPYTGAYLGSIGRGYLKDPVDIVYRNNVVHVLEKGSNGIGRIFQFNASTGEPIANFALSNSWGKVGILSSLTLTPTGSYLVSDYTLTNNASYVNEYTSSGGYLTSRYWAQSGSRLCGVQLNSTNGRVYAASVNDNKIVCYNYAIGNSTAVQEVAAPGGPIFMSTIGNYLYYSANTVGDTIYRTPIGADGSLGPVVGFDPSIAVGSPIIGVAGGHTGFGYVCQYAGSQYQYARFSTNTLDPMGTFGDGVMRTPWGRIEVIVAPEPASMIGLALGIASLTRRRKT